MIIPDRYWRGIIVRVRTFQLDKFVKTYPWGTVKLFRGFFESSCNLMFFQINSFYFNFLLQALYPKGV